MEEKKDLMVQQNQSTGIDFFGSVNNFKEGWNIAMTLAKSDIIPNTFRSKPANVLIALDMAQRMNINPMTVFQNLYVVSGSPSFSAQFAISCFNETGRYTAIKYKEEGERGKDSWGFRAYATEKSTGEVVLGPLVTIGTAKAEGWYAKNPKWTNVPELMLRYRAASWFIRTTDPGVMMGFQTREEIEDAVVLEESTQPLTPTDEEIAKEVDDNTGAETITMPADTDKEEPAANAEKEKQEKPKDEPVKPMGKAETPTIFGN